MFKINIMQIMKFITAVVCFSLFGFAVYSMNQSKASPLPFLICACILYVVDGISWQYLVIVSICTSRDTPLSFCFLDDTRANRIA